MAVALAGAPIAGGAGQNVPINPKRILQTFLLATTIPFTIISIIPSLRLVGSIGVRSISCLSAILNFTNGVKQNNKWLYFTNNLKIAAVICGIVALSASLPALIVASLVTDIATESFELGKSMCKGDWDKFAVHGFQIITNAFVLTAILTGSFQFLFAAVALNAIIHAGRILVLCVHCSRKNRCEGEDITDIVLYSILTLLTIPNLVMITEYIGQDYKGAKFTIKGDKDYDINLYGKNKYLGTVKPGETREIIVPQSDLVSGGSRYISSTITGVKNTLDPVTSGPYEITADWRTADHYVPVTRIEQIPVGDFNKVVVGGPAIVSHDPS